VNGERRVGGDSRSATQFTFKGNAKNVRSFD